MVWGFVDPRIWVQVKNRPAWWIDARKTSAHVSLSACLTDQQRRGWSVNKVDELAKNAVRRWNPLFPIFSQNEKSFQEFEGRCRKLGALQDVILRQASLARPSAIQKTQNDDGEICSKYKIPSRRSVVLFKWWIFPATVLLPLYSCAFKLQWPTPATGEVSEPKGLGAIFALKDQCKDAEVVCQTLAQQTWVWNLFLKLARKNNLRLWSSSYVHGSTALKDMGFTLWTSAVSNHPRFTQGDAVYRTIHNFFVTKSGKVRNFNIARHGPQVAL